MEAETRYHPSADQLALGSTIDESLAALLPLSRLHASYQEDAKTWSSLEEIGVFGIGVSEELGGSGLGRGRRGTDRHGPGTPPRIARGPGDDRRSACAAQRRRCRIPRQRESLLPIGAAIGSSSSMSPRRISCFCETAAVPQLHDARTCTSRPVDDRLWLAALREAAGVGEQLARFDESQLARLRLIDAAALAGIAEATLEMSVAYARNAGAVWPPHRQFPGGEAPLRQHGDRRTLRSRPDELCGGGAG